MPTLASHVLALFALSAGIAAQTGALLHPIRVSSKKADSNLQVKTLTPEYPPEAKAKGLEGVVRLRIVINERGNVVDAKALSGNPLLVPSAIALVKRYPYRPFTRRKTRVVVSTDVDVPFELHPTTQHAIYERWMRHRNAAGRLRKDEKADAAIAELQEALVDARKLGDSDVADTYGDIAMLYLKEGRYGDAELPLLKRLDILQHSQVQNELETANTQADLATLYVMQRRLEEPQELLHKAIPVQEKYMQQASLPYSKDLYAKELAMSLGSLALLHELEGRLSDADPLYKRSIALGRQRLSPDDEATIMLRYAELLTKTGRSDEAADLRKDATALQLGLNRPK